jgi:hypothetical protein
MRSLTAAELLNVWERGQTEPPVRQALALLAAACPETPPDEIARLAIGRRDRLLLELRERTFGPRLVSVAACPACGERLEVEVAVRDLLVEGADAADPADGPGEASRDLEADGWHVRFRPPHSLDMLALTEGGPDRDAGAARQRLLAGCLLGARTPDGGEADAGDLPESVLLAVAGAMAAADPQAEIELALTCPACAHAWLALFDIVSFFWTEIDAWARVLLQEIHVLASAYGWREPDILALSPWRRRAYLEMLGR